MKKRERLVRIAIVQAYDWVIGGKENALEDNQIDKMPPVDELEQEIYDELMDRKEVRFSNGMSMEIKKDIRFLGKDRIFEMISKEFANRRYREKGGESSA